MLVDADLVQTLRVVGQAGSLVAAASRLHVSAAAVSQRIKLLEHQLGFPLFERVGRRNRMTVAGKALFDAAEACFTPLDETIARLSGDVSAVRGDVCIGVPRSLSSRWFRPLVVEFKKRNPEFVPVLQFAAPWVLAPRLIAGEIDLCVFVGTADVGTGIETKLLWNSEMVAVASPAFLKSHGTPRTFDEFVACPRVLYSREEPSAHYWWRAHFGRVPSVLPVAAALADSPDEMLALAEAGMGMTILLEEAVRAGIKRGTVVALHPRRSDRDVTPRGVIPVRLGWRRGAVKTARVRAFRDFVLANASNRQGSVERGSTSS